MTRLSKISKILSRAAPTYDTHALIQPLVARRLAFKILSHHTASLGTVLEVGCGTGLLSSHLASHANFYFLTDIVLPFLKQAEKKIKNEKAAAVMMDGERPCVSASFDMVVSSLALHWLENPKEALTQLAACLKPGGSLYISALGSHTFHEWRTAHSLREVPCGLWNFLSFGQLKEGLPLAGIRHVEEEWISVRPKNSLEFLRSLKDIGGHFPHSKHKPLAYKAFKGVRDLYDKHTQSSYQILYATYHKPKKVREE